MVPILKLLGLPHPPKHLDCGVHYLCFAFVCFLIRSHPPKHPEPQGLQELIRFKVMSREFMRDHLGGRGDLGGRGGGPTHHHNPERPGLRESLPRCHVSDTKICSPTVLQIRCVINPCAGL